jgi:hypothetical protein
MKELDLFCADVSKFDPLSVPFTLTLGWFEIVGHASSQSKAESARQATAPPSRGAVCPILLNCEEQK